MVEDLLPKKALFEGLIYDEYDRPVQTGYVGSDPCYIVDDAGFLRHIPSETVDRQVWQFMQEQIEGNEDLLSAKAAEMMGQDDIFTMAAIQNQLKNMDSQFEQLAEIGIPEESRLYMGMIGFRIVISVHGDVLEIKQPGVAADPDEE
jgi:hypothetical protein